MTIKPAVWILAGTILAAGCTPPNAGHDADAVAEAAPDAVAPDAADPAYVSVEVDANGFIVNGEYTLLRGGTVQWFRMPEEVWDDRLRRFKAAGFNTVEMYVAWNHHEPEEGVFDFETYDIRRFLDLAKSHGLYVYFRPGPYITNELDGGGVPAWIFTRTTKKNRERDGRVNLRTNDPDYLDYVERYYGALNEVIKPYLISNGGPIILYSIENEFDWFEMFHDVDKLFWYDGGTERGPLQKPDTRGYLAALRDMVRDDGIDVPITTCPGDARVAGMGDVEGVIPMPNVYKQGGTEKIAYDIVTSMHDPEQFGGAYVDYPTGSTETDRTATRMKRLFMGGMDGSFHFNIVGMSQSGYRNAVVLDNGGNHKIFDLSLDNIVNGFVSPTVGYFHNVIDYYGAIGPSGTLRTKFHDFRRTNLFFDAFQTTIGAVGQPQFDDPRVTLEHGALAADYWLDAGDGTYFIGVVNESSASQDLPVGGLVIDGQALPRYVPMTVPAADYPGAASDGGTELENSSIVVAGLPLVGDLRIAYTTSEILTLREHNGRQLLVVYGVEGARGELALEGSFTTVSRDGSIEDRGDAFTFEYGEPARLVVASADAELEVLVVTRPLAGRAWFTRARGADYAVLGPDYVTDMRVDDAGQLEVSYEHEAASLEVLALTPSGASTLSLATGPEAPALPDVLSIGRTQSDRGESEPVLADDDGWRSWSGDPRPLEELGIYRGHAWYRAEFDINEDPARRWLGWALKVEHASDIVGIYVNGHYVTTVAPHGTEIDNRNWNSDYSFPDPTPYLVEGRNVIAFRTEVWGHGSFMWPRGFMISNKASLPSVGFDSVKGLWGKATLGPIRLTEWSVRAELGGERDEVFAPAFDDASWTAASVPLDLERGAVQWYRTEFDASDLPDPALFHAPVVLRLAGVRAKATIYVNGVLIGRWLSDADWLRRGTWARGTRDMWMNTSPDDFPISIETVRDGRNVVAIAFEDASGDDQDGGRIDSLALRYHQEVKRLDAAGHTTRGSRLTRRGSFAVAP